MLVLLAAGVLIGTAPVQTAFDRFPLGAEDSAAAIRIRIADGLAAATATPAVPLAAEAELPSHTRY